MASRSLQSVTKRAVAASRYAAQHGALRQKTLIEVPPERDQQLSRQGDDPNFPNAAVALPKLLLVPAGVLTNAEAGAELRKAPARCALAGALLCFGAA